MGDWSFAGPAGLLVPHLEARFDTASWVVDGLSQYRSPIDCAIAHELNHMIGWDDPHDFCLRVQPTEYERQVVSGSPWMSVTPSDITPPTVAFSASTGMPIAGTATIAVEANDGGGMDAVVLLVEGMFAGVDTTSPYSFSLDTTRLNFGSRELTAIAYDLAGNTSEAFQPLTVRNTVSGGSCSTQFPLGTFHACFFDGIGATGPYLGTLLDTPSWRSDNVAIAIDHGFSTGVAFDQTETFTGVWRGQFDFPPENYRFRLEADDGLRVVVNGSLVIDEWHEGYGSYEAIVPLDGLATIEVQWYQEGGGERLRFAWGPTLNPPPGMFTISADVDGRGGVTSSPSGISCGLDLDCYQSFPSGQTVTLTPEAIHGATFVGWSGDPDCTDGVVTAGANKRCVAKFEGGVAPTGGSFTSLSPARILDTRDGTGGISTKVGAGQSVSVAVIGRGGVPASGVGSVVMNVTATGATAATYLTVFPAGQPRPLASNLNVVPGQDIPNLVVAKVGSNGQVGLYNNQGAVDVIFDVVGWFPATGGSFTSLSPARILDTRDGTGGISAKVGAGQSVSVAVTGRGGVPASGVGSVVMNVTATGATAATYLTVFPAGQARPLASNLNVVPGQDIPNLVVAKVGSNGQVGLYNNQGAVDVIFDVVGWFPATGP